MPEQEMDMTRGSPMRLMVRFSLPLLFGNALEQFYNMVDSWVVGNFVGTSAMAAVGIAFPIIFLLTSLFIGMAVGTSILIAQFFGAGDRDGVRRSVDTVYGALMVSILPLTLLALLASGPILRLIQVPESVYEEAHIYLMVVFAGIIGNLGYNVNAGILQGLGDSRTPLLFLSVACGINIVLDLLFVLVFHWGVFGVALATILAQCFSWIFGVFHINRTYKTFRICLFRSPMDRGLLKRVLRLGIPSGIQQCQLAVAVLVIQALINSFGEAFAAGFSAANKIDTFAFMPVDSFCLAVTTYVGQNVGAGRLDRVKDGVRKSLLLCVGTCLVISVLVVPNSAWLISIFNKDPAVIAAGQAYLVRVLSTMWLLSIMYPLNNALRGAGASVVPMVSSIVALWGARVPAAYVLAHFFGKENLYWAYPIGWTVGIVISGIVYLRGKWKLKCAAGLESVPDPVED